MRRKGFIGAIVLAIAIFGSIILALFCTSRVPAGYVGVVYNMNGGVDGEVLSQGWHLVAPTKKVTTYSIGNYRLTLLDFYCSLWLRFSISAWDIEAPSNPCKRLDWRALGAEGEI